MAIRVILAAALALAGLGLFGGAMAGQDGRPAADADRTGTTEISAVEGGNAEALDYDGDSYRTYKAVARRASALVVAAEETEPAESSPEGSEVEDSGKECKTECKKTYDECREKCGLDMYCGIQCRKDDVKCNKACGEE